MFDCLVDPTRIGQSRCSALNLSSQVVVQLDEDIIFGWDFETFIASF